MTSLPLFQRPTITDTPKPNLRPYQERAVRLARMHAEDKKRILLTLPTASGKMVIIAAIIRTSTVPALFACHRMELVDQCARELERRGITNIGVMRGDDERTNPSASVQIASIQTLARRPKPPAGLVIIDEAHRALSDSYLEHIFNYYQDAIILGFTASPCRGDGRPMGDVFEVLETVATYSELLKRPEWLAEPDCYGTPEQPMLSTVPTKHGDYEETALAHVMSQKHLVGNLLDHWLSLSDKYPTVDPRTKKIIPGAFTTGERRRTFVFAVNIEHSKLICKRFAAAGVRIAHLDGTTPEDERRAILADLRTGKLECVSSCNVLLEGVDVPEAKCVLHARPTHSLVLYLQSCGRVMRPWNGVRPLILDHADNWSRHGAPHEDRVWSLKNTVGRKSTSKPCKLCKACFAYVALSLSVCPYCKNIFTAAEMQLPRETSDRLVMREMAPEKRRKEFFDRMAVLSRVKGYKPGFAAAKHKEEFGDWPPNEWSEGLKALFATDSIWQERLADRERQKLEEEQAWEVPPPTEDVSMDVGNDPWQLNEGETDSMGKGFDEHGWPLESVSEKPFEKYEDGDETFSAWTRREFGGA